MSRFLFIFLVLISGLILSCSGNRQKQSADVPEKVVAKKLDSTEVAEPKLASSAKSRKKFSEKKTDLPPSDQQKKYSLRKYNHVADFYHRISWPAIQTCVANNVPPAAVLAIAGLESGWNKGYVGRITGNILSLGARKGDAELPALRLPRLISTNKILFDSLVIIKYDEDELKWEDRPESLKKDYRPPSIAGTPYQLAYFKYHPIEKANAQVQNITDFLTIFISRNSRIAVYREARHLMDSLVQQNGKEILFDDATARKFINTIGGRLNSFNYRETWPKKVEYIMKNAGLVELTGKMYLEQKDFEEAW